MALSPVGVGTALAALAPFVDYLRPKRSPYLLVVLFGIVGLIAAAGLFQMEFQHRQEFFFLFVPVSAVLILLTLFSFLHQVKPVDDLSAEEVDEQMKFSRSLCISVAILCLVLGCWRATKSLPGWVFEFHYVVCILQIVVFVVYSAARIRYEEPSSSLNHFQIALVTSAYLAAATVCISLINTESDKTADVFHIIEKTEIDKNKMKNEFLNLLSLASILFYTLWIWCQFYWIKRLIKIIRISVEPPE